MVALLYFTELGAVLPLLKILFNNESPQRWISSKIDSIEENIVVLNAQAGEVRRSRPSPSGGSPIDRAIGTLSSTRSRSGVVGERLREHQRLVDLPDLKRQAIQNVKHDPAEINDLKRQQRIVEERIKELSRGSKWLKEGKLASLRYRQQEIKDDLKSEEVWLGRYQRLKPLIYRYIPSDSFRNLVLLLGLVLIGVAIKGFFMFLQELLVAQVMQLTQFSIRNHFFRRTLNLDLGSFTDQGSAELMARFTNDMDSFGQGLVTLLSKLIREPLRVVFCLTGAFWLNWRLTCLTLVVVPISAVTTYRVGRVMKRAMRRSLESMSSIYKILQESFQGIKVVKAFAMERMERRRFFIATKNFYKKATRVAMIDAMSDPVLEMLTLVTVSIALPGGLVPGSQADDLSRSWSSEASARLAGDGDRGAAHAVRRACRCLRPDPQAGQCAFEAPAPRRRPTGFAPDGPRAPGRGTSRGSPPASARSIHRV